MFAEAYRLAAERGIGALEIDRTPLWKVGAMLRPPPTPTDETLDVFRERMAGAELDEEFFRASRMADVIPLVRRAGTEPPGAPRGP